MNRKLMRLIYRSAPSRSMTAADIDALVARSAAANHIRTWIFISCRRLNGVRCFSSRPHSANIWTPGRTDENRDPQP